MKQIFLFVCLSAMSASCQRAPIGNDNTREVFDADGMKVITAFANRMQQTMSVLYGNDAAINEPLSAHHQKIAGAKFTLVTYRQADNKYWYGSYINGRIKSVETILCSADIGNTFIYKLEQGDPPKDHSGNIIKSNDRISEILSRRPSVFP